MTFRRTACFSPSAQDKHEKHFIFQLKFNYKKSAEIPLCTVFLWNDSPVKRTLIALPCQLLALFHTDVYLSPVNAPVTLPLRY